MCVEAKRTVNGRLTKELTIREGYYLHTSPDLIHWSRARPTFYGTEPNIQIYGHSAMIYQGMYIGFRWRAPTDYFWQDVHAIELGLDCSRDSRVWTRVGGGPDGGEICVCRRG